MRFRLHRSSLFVVRWSAVASVFIVSLVVSTGAATWIRADRDPEQRAVFEVSGQEELERVAREAEQLVDFDVPVIDISELGLSPSYVTTDPDAVGGGVPGGATSRDRVTVVYHSPGYRIDEAAAFEGIELSITYGLGSASLGHQAVVSGGQPQEIQAINEVPSPVVGYTLTEVVDTEFGGAYRGYLLSSSERWFQVVVARSRPDVAMDVPGRDAIIPFLSELAHAGTSPD